MRLKRKENQSRRDFVGIYECESCGHEQRDPYGYDDANYHRNVIPAMVCGSCGATGTAVKSAPDVPAGLVL